MAFSLRFYLFAEDGLKRISQRVMMALVHAQDAMPQYAGTKQKVANVILEVDNAKPLRIERIEGSFLRFDDKGQVHKDLVASGFAALDTGLALQQALRRPTGKVVDLAPKLNREKWERENRWTPTKEDLEAIADDIWRKRAGEPRIEQAKGAAPKPPRVTYEAKEAVREILSLVTSIDNKLRWLSEVDLKGFAFEAREVSKGDSSRPVWLGIAQLADHYREILTRRRTGRGTWYAVLHIMRWDTTRRTAETTASFHKRCGSKAEAEEAARALLVEHAKDFSGDISIEAEVLCDLEWDAEEDTRLL
ncbi:hypothetical protein ABIE88_008507 [Bradyrhizobium diazoefficiens]|uniref:hypothetical protein n=1 Tax=Bradyrhizobium TaxID=374 RepID=UPI003182E374